MKYREFAAIGRRVSAIALGSTGFGSAMPEAQAFEALEAYAAAGGNFLDTARAYGDMASGVYGLAEVVIGSWLEGRRDRENFVIVTKGGFPPPGDMHRPRLDRASLTEDLDRSLEALRVDRVDLYFVHRDDPNRSVEDILVTLNGFVNSGRVRAFGASNWTRPRIEEAMSCAKRLGLRGFEAVQNQFSLPRQLVVEDDTAVQMDPELFAFHRRSGVPLMAYSALAKGFLAKMAAAGEAGLTPKAKRRFLGEENLRISRKIGEISQRTGVSPGALGLNWLMQQPFMVIPVVGVSSAAQVRLLAEAGETELSAADLEELTRLTPYAASDRGRPGAAQP